MAVYEIEIVNWEKYNPRGDMKKHHWFRFEIDMIDDDPVIANLSLAQFKVWVGILCMRCRELTTKFILDTRILQRKCRVRTSVIHDTITHLTNSGRLETTYLQSETNDVLGPVALQPKSGRIRALRNDTYDTYDTYDYISHLKKDDPNPIQEFSPKDLSEIWNTHCGALPKVDTLSEPRKKKAKARITERPDREYWVAIVKRLSASPFCLGNNDRSWRATFDFLIKPDTHVRTIEGMYDPRDKVAGKSSLEQFDEMMRAEAAKVGANQ